jgi:hypothetical protein
MPTGKAFVRRELFAFYLKKQAHLLKKPDKYFLKENNMSRIFHML